MGIGERKHLFTGIVNANWYNYLEISMKVPQNILKHIFQIIQLYQIWAYTKDSASHSRDIYSSMFITVLYSSIFITHTSKE